MNDLVKRAQAAALPDPNDEREVMHAHLLRELAAEIERLRAELKQERTAGRRPLETSHDLVLADRERLRADYALLQAGYNEQAESREKAARGAGNNRQRRWKALRLDGAGSTGGPR